MLVGAAVIAIVVGVARPAASAEPNEVSTGMATEAWYTPVPALPSGVPMINPYPPDTLHVSMTAGRESARTYLSLDLSALPVRISIEQGTLILPVAEEDAGTRNLDDAEFQACVVTEPFEDGTEGSADAPGIDCSIAAPAKRTAADELRIELAPLLAHWDDGAPNHGLALTPSEETQEGQGSWHVAFSGRKRTGEVARPITATLLLASSSTPPVGDPSVGGDVAGPSAPSASETLAPPSTSPGVVPANPAEDLPAPDARATTMPTAPTTPRALASVSSRFRYPTAFLVPLALLGGAWFFAKALTRPIRVR